MQQHHVPLLPAPGLPLMRSDLFAVEIAGLPVTVVCDANPVSGHGLLLTSDILTLISGPRFLPLPGSPSFFFCIVALYRRHVVAYAFTRSAPQRACRFH